MLPTLVSAIQARQNLDSAVADVVLLLFYEGVQPNGLFNRICLENDIFLITVPVRVLQGYSPMYARLFLNGVLPAIYSRILYMDGDVQITGPLDDLISTDFLEDHFLAVADPMSVDAYSSQGPTGFIDSYFESLGVKSTPQRPYFNSGVLLVCRTSWTDICRDSLAFLSSSPELCRFQDQSALNFAGHRKMQPLSFRWNFPIFFRNCGVEAAIQPQIFHFMSKPKPWQGAFPPWGQLFSEPYTQLLNDYPELGVLAQPLPAMRYLKYAIQQQIKRIQETFEWRFSKRRGAILEFNAAAKA